MSTQNVASVSLYFRAFLLVFLLGVVTVSFVQPVFADGLGRTTTSEDEDGESEEDGGSDDTQDEENEDDKNDKDAVSDNVNTDPCDDKGEAGEPVSLYDGRLKLAKTDLTVNGLFPIRITRRYDNRSTYDSAIGYGWSLNHDRRLYEYADGSVVIRYGCGAKDRFVYTGSAYVTPDDGRQGDLTENPDGSFVYTRSYGTKEYYDSQGRLTAVQNRFGHRHEYNYDVAGKLPLTGTSPFSLDPTTPMVVAYQYRITQVQERAADGVLTGNHVDFNYDGSTGRLSSVVASDGRTVSYVHDSLAGATSGNLITVNGLENIVKTYQYTDPNDSHNLTSIQEAVGETAWVSVYDAQDRVVQQTHGNDVFDFNYLIELTETEVAHTIADALGSNSYTTVKFYEFDGAGDVLLARDGLGNEVRYVRDTAGNMQEKQFYENGGTLASPSLSLVRTILFGHDSLQRRLSQIVTLDSGETVTKSWTYDNGWLASEETVSSADTSKVFRTEYTFYRDGNGVPTNISSIRRRKDDGSYQVTNFTYDAKNRLTTTTLPDGQVVKTLYEGGSLYPTKQYFEIDVGGTPTESAKGRLQFTYDSQGNRNSVTDGRGNTTNYVYDDLARLTQVSNALNEETNYTYVGPNLTQVEVGRTVADGEGQLTRYTYNNERRLTNVEEKDDAAAWQPVVSFTYDSVGNRLSETDADSRTTNYSYDVLGRLASVSDPLSKVTQFDYDMFGNRTKLTDALLRETVTTYDDLDRVSQVEQIGSPANIVTAFTYNALGDLLTVTDGESNTTTYTIDTLSRVTAITQPLGQQVQKIYDERDRLSEFLNARGHRMVYGYEPQGTLETVNYYTDAVDTTADRTITYSYDDALNMLSVIDTNIQPTAMYTYTYDALNRTDVSTASYIPGGNRTLDYGYDRYGNQNSLVFNDAGTSYTHTYNYDRRNRLASAVLPGSQNFGFTYTDSGETQTMTYPNGIVASYIYRANGPVESITYTGSAGQMEQFAYTYDDVLNVDTMTDSNGVWDYGYDDFDRLTTADYPASTSFADEAFTYDRVGNREDPGDPALYQYDQNNRIANSPGLTYGFDNDGSMVSRSDGQALTYNKDNRLVQFNDGSTTASYQYDPFGRRISKTVNGAKTWFVWEGTSLLGEFDGAGAQSKRYAKLPRDVFSIQLADSNGIYNIHEGFSQEPRFSSDTEQDIVWRADYRVFGQASEDNDPDGDSNLVGNNERYPGQYNDNETNQAYNYFRYYDAGIARYNRVDPIGFDYSLNPYGYVSAGNPISFYDPLGLTMTNGSQSKKGGKKYYTRPNHNRPKWYYPNYPSKDGRIPLPPKKPRVVDDPNASIKAPDNLGENYRDPTAGRSPDISSSHVDSECLNKCLAQVVIGTTSQEVATQQVTKNPFTPEKFKSCFGAIAKKAGPVGNAITGLSAIDCVNKCTVVTHPTGTYGWK